MEKLLETIELETGKNPTTAIIWMHGLGADGNDFVPIVNELGLTGAPPVRFVFPHAPKRPVTINNGFVMRAWYDVSLGDLEGKSRRPDAVGVHESQEQIDALIQREGKRGIAANKVVLAGFSQGGAIALHTGLRYPEKLAGIMALSTYLPLPDTLPTQATAANKPTAILMAHGVYDPVVPLMMGAGSMTFLAGLGYRVEWKQYPMQHSLCAEEVQDIGEWLRKILKT